MTEKELLENIIKRVSQNGELKYEDETENSILCMWDNLDSVEFVYDKETGEIKDIGIYGY